MTKTSARARLEKAFDQFVDIRTLSDMDAAKKINTCEIDILVDLTGFTKPAAQALSPYVRHPFTSIGWALLGRWV